MTVCTTDPFVFLNLLKLNGQDVENNSKTLSPFKLIMTH